MSRLFEDNLLSDQVRGAIHDFALEARRVLMEEARELLEGVYGLRNDGRFEPPDNLPALSDPEKREIYDRLVRFLDDEVQAGLGRPEAVEKLRKEISFTHLNRLVAFKMMEKRKLMREAVGRGTKSNGFLFYLADHLEDRALWQAGQSEMAYQHFLLWQAGQIAQEIKVLFDPESLPSRLFPRAQTVQAILDLINSLEIAPAWDTDEAIGWIYQFFIEEEKDSVNNRINKKKEKLQRKDIPAATQLFTPRWIVRFLVENTLGRYWVEMHPDSELRNMLRYLVPKALPGRNAGQFEDVLPSHTARSRSGHTSPQQKYLVEPVKDITMLDPACGAMHFGVLAFDLFTEMYREEILWAGEPGWPETPSVEAEAEIPAAILANNLFGIDIDLRAVQLAVLSLYLKAKSLNKDAAITHHNLACADVLTLNGKRLGEFLKEAQFSRPIYERLIRSLWKKLENINQYGSLLRLEQEVETLIADERARYEREGRQVDMFLDRSGDFEPAAAKEEFWGILGGQILQAVDHFAKKQSEIGVDQRFFVGEAIKGLQVLDLMLRKYDIVVTNPPYRGKRDLNRIIGKFLEDSYTEGKGDLYAAFILRCSELLNETGRLGMITQQSFMFISSYKTLRKGLLQKFSIETMAHTGTRAFPEIKGEKVNTTAFVLKQEDDPIKRCNHIGTYFRLVHEPDAESKRVAFECMVAALRKGVVSSGVYRVVQGRFDAIPRSPWVYWISEEVRKLFTDLPKMSDASSRPYPCNSSDNFRFVRLIWEVSTSSIGISNKWIYYSKGGGFRKWFGNLYFVIDWSEQARNYYSANSIARITDKESWYKEVLTYSAIATSRFCSRFFPPGGVFDRKGPAIRINKTESSLSFLGILNSRLINWILELLNPTISVQAGDIDRIPVPNLSEESDDNIKINSSKCVRLSQVETFQIEPSTHLISPQIFREHSAFKNAHGC